MGGNGGSVWDSPAVLGHQEEPGLLGVEVHEGEKGERVGMSGCSRRSSLLELFPAPPSSTQQEGNPCLFLMSVPSGDPSETWEFIDLQKEIIPKCG